MMHGTAVVPRLRATVVVAAVKIGTVATSWIFVVGKGAFARAVQIAASAVTVLNNAISGATDLKVELPAGVGTWTTTLVPDTLAVQTPAGRGIVNPGVDGTAVYVSTAAGGKYVLPIVGADTTAVKIPAGTFAAKVCAGIVAVAVKIAAGAPTPVAIPGAKELKVTIGTGGTTSGLQIGRGTLAVIVRIPDGAVTV